MAKLNRSILRGIAIILLSLLPLFGLSILILGLKSTLTIFGLAFAFVTFGVGFVIGANTISDSL